MVATDKGGDKCTQEQADKSKVALAALARALDRQGKLAIMRFVPRRGQVRLSLMSLGLSLLAARTLA